MAVALTAAFQGNHVRTFNVAALAGDTAADSVSTPHGFGAVTPPAFKIVDTTVLGTTQGQSWTIRLDGASNFIVRKVAVTAEDRTALVTIYNPHSAER
jgi:hypothetical protein